jgi:hypothetical protein
MKTSKLTGAALDWAVARCEGFSVRNGFDDNCPEYSTDWSQGGPIIERENIEISVDRMGCPLWTADITDSLGVYIEHTYSGTTPLIAAMRCYVASNLGDDVEIPKELA